jgi:hypothetical protein
VDLSSGLHRSLEFRRDQWGYLDRGVWKPLGGAFWRVTLDMEALKELGYSESAFYSAQFTFDQARALLLSTNPFAPLLDGLEPLELPARSGGLINGNHLQFGRDRGQRLDDVLRHGVLHPPPRPVRLTVVASQTVTAETDQQLKNFLIAHLVPRERIAGHHWGEEALKAVGAQGGNDTIATIWTSSVRYRRGFGLEPFDIVERLIHRYDATSGTLLAPEHLAKVRDDAKAAGRGLIALVFVDEAMPKHLHDNLMKQFHSIRAVPLKPSSLTKQKGYPAWVNLTLKLAQKAGAIPWDLVDVPGVDESTVFVGVDLGHDHKNEVSHVAFTLIDCRGRPVDRFLRRCRRNNERIPTDLLTVELPQFLSRLDRPAPSQVIVHRDGRYLLGEAADLLEGLGRIPRVTLVAIKKDANTRLGPEVVDGSYWCIDPVRALLITNTQAKGSSMPDPLEIELEEPGDLLLDHAVAQVFWLSRVCRGNAYHPHRLPLTTEWANNIAATGKKVYLRGWEQGDE